MKADALGRQGEAMAEAYLCAQGMRTLARRYRGGDGELDLVMEDGEQVVFVEVKASGRDAAGVPLVLMWWRLLRPGCAMCLAPLRRVHGIDAHCEHLG